MSFEQRVRQQQTATNEEERKKAAQVQQPEQAAESRKLEILSSIEWQLMKMAAYDSELRDALRTFWEAASKPTINLRKERRAGGIKGLFGKTEQYEEKHESNFSECISIDESPELGGNCMSDRGVIRVSLAYGNFQSPDYEAFENTNYHINIEIGFLLEQKQIKTGTRLGDLGREVDTYTSYGPGIVIHCSSPRVSSYICESIDDTLDYLAFAFRRQFPNAIGREKLSNSE